MKKQLAEEKPSAMRYDFGCAIICMPVACVLVSGRATAQNAVVDSLPEKTPGMYEGHAYVDLGLSVKWASCNVGASRPSDNGYYFAWGETEQKESYMEGNSKTYSKGKHEYDTGGRSELDAAIASWGGAWRLPTEVEMQELVEQCSWSWTTWKGRQGYMVTSKKSRNFIFLPAAGYRCGTSLDGSDEYGFYWTSVGNEDYRQYASCMYFFKPRHGVSWANRSYGLPVRPVVEL